MWDKWELWFISSAAILLLLMKKDSEQVRPTAKWITIMFDALIEPVFRQCIAKADMTLFVTLPKNEMDGIGLGTGNGNAKYVKQVARDLFMAIGEFFNAAVLFTNHVMAAPNFAAAWAIMVLVTQWFDWCCITTDVYPIVIFVPIVELPANLSDEIKKTIEGFFLLSGTTIPHIGWNFRNNYRKKREQQFSKNMGSTTFKRLQRIIDLAYWRGSILGVPAPSSNGDGPGLGNCAESALWLRLWSLLNKTELLNRLNGTNIYLCSLSVMRLMRLMKVVKNASSMFEAPSDRDWEKCFDDLVKNDGKDDEAVAYPICFRCILPISVFMQKARKALGQDFTIHFWELDHGVWKELRPWTEDEINTFEAETKLHKHRGVPPVARTCPKRYMDNPAIVPPTNDSTLRQQTEVQQSAQGQQQAQSDMPRTIRSSMPAPPKHKGRS